MRCQGWFAGAQLGSTLQHERETRRPASWTFYKDHMFSAPFNRPSAIEEAAED
jgi:hypothetical protein